MADIQMLAAIPQAMSGGETGFSRTAENDTKAFGQALTHAKTSFGNNDHPGKKSISAKSGPGAGPADGKEKTRGKATKPNGVNKKELPKPPVATENANSAEPIRNVGPVSGETIANTSCVANEVILADDNGLFQPLENMEEDSRVFIRQPESATVIKGETLADSSNVGNAGRISGHVGGNEVVAEQDGAKTVVQSQQGNRQPGQVIPMYELGKDIAIDGVDGKVELIPDQGLTEKIAIAAKPGQVAQDGQATNQAEPQASVSANSLPEAKTNTAENTAAQTQVNNSANADVSQGDAAKALSVRSEMVAELPTEDKPEGGLSMPSSRILPLEIESALPKQARDGIDGLVVLEEDNQNDSVRTNIKGQTITSENTELSKREQAVAGVRGERSENDETARVAKSSAQAKKVQEQIEGNERSKSEHRQASDRTNQTNQANKTNEARATRNHRTHEIPGVRNAEEAETGKGSSAARGEGGRRAGISSSQAQPEKVQVGHAPVRTDIGQHQMGTKETGRAQESRSNATEGNASQRPDALLAKAQTDPNTSNNSDNPARHRTTAHNDRPGTSSNVSVSHTAPFSAANVGVSNPAQAATPSAPEVPKKPYLPPQAPMAQLEGSVKWLLRNDARMAEIQLYPEHLGRVTVRLRIEGNEVHARVWASEASTIPMLKEHRAFLENSLKEQGLNLSSFDLQQGRGGQQTEGDNRNGQNHNHGQHFHFAPQMMESWNGSEFRQELPVQLTAQSINDGRVELYA